MKIVKKTIMSLTVLAILLPMVSCEAVLPPALVGHWLHESGPKKGQAEDMELFKDGTGVCDGITISWKVENKRFVISSSVIGFACDYKLSGSKLTLIYNDGSSVTYLTKAEHDKARAREKAEKEKAEKEAATEREKAIAEADAAAQT